MRVITERALPTTFLFFSGTAAEPKMGLGNLPNKCRKNKMYSVGETCPVPKYEAERAREARENQVSGGGDKKSEKAKSLSSNLNEPIRTAAEVAKKIGVSENTYRDTKTSEARYKAFLGVLIVYPTRISKNLFTDVLGAF